MSCAPRPIARIFSILAAIVLVAGLAPGQARAFSFAENVNNDLDNFPNQPGDPLTNIPSGELIVTEGLNFAEGAFRCFGFGCRDNFDSFRMIVPAGLQITFTSFEVQNNDGTSETLLIYPGGTFLDPSPNPQAGWGVWNVGASLVLFDSINPAGPNTSNMIFGPGAYDVVTYNWNEIGGGSFQLLMTATAIPEPSLTLMLGTVAGIALATWRRR